MQNLKEIFGAVFEKMSQKRKKKVYFFHVYFDFCLEEKQIKLGIPSSPTFNRKLDSLFISPITILCLLLGPLWEPVFLTHVVWSEGGLSTESTINRRVEVLHGCMCSSGVAQALWPWGDIGRPSAELTSSAEKPRRPPSSPHPLIRIINTSYSGRY